MVRRRDQKDRCRKTLGILRVASGKHCVMSGKHCVVKVVNGIWFDDDDHFDRTNYAFHVGHKRGVFVLQMNLKKKKNIDDLRF